jgi:hypothetical protein
MRNFEGLANGTVQIILDGEVGREEVLQSKSCVFERLGSVVVGKGETSQLVQGASRKEVCS